MSLRGAPELKRTPHQDSRAIAGIAARLGDLLARGEVAYTHPENFLADADFNRFWMTDFLDTFSLHEFPRQIESDLYDEAGILFNHIVMIAFYSQYNEKLHWPAWLKSLVDPLAERGIFLSQKTRTLLDAKKWLELPMALLRAGLAHHIFRARLGQNYDPLKDLAAELDAPCTDLDRQTLGDLFIPFLQAMEAKENGSGRDKLLGLIREEMEAYRDEKLTFDEFLNRPVILLALEFGRRLRVRFSPEKINPTYQIIFRAGMPGLLELKGHLEREHRVLTAAASSHPQDPDVRANLKRLGELVNIYRTTSLRDLRHMICHDRPAFKRLFRLPYHGGR